MDFICDFMNIKFIGLLLFNTISAIINPKFNSENLNQVDNHEHLGVTIT
jgi:hypothetical protein